MKAKFPEARITLLEGGGGVFDVKCDGKLIFSKLGVKGQRFPHEGEITRLIDKEIG